MSVFKKLSVALLILANLLGSVPFVDAASALRPYVFGQNLVSYGESLGDPAQWTPYHVTATLNTTETQDPWGTNKATKIVEDATTNMHYITRGVAVAASDLYTYSIFLKNGNRRYVTIYLNDLNNTRQVTYDLVAGGVKNVGTGASGYMISMGNGWYRCVLVPKTAPGAAAAAYILMNNTSGPYAGYAGDGSSYVYAVGAQAVFGNAPGAYNKSAGTTVNATLRPYGPSRANVMGQNLLTYSEAFDNGAWTKNHITISADAVANPVTGEKTADAFVEDGTTGYVFAGRAISSVGDGTFSFFVKGAGRNFANMLVQSASGNFWYTINLTTGASVSVPASGTNVSAQQFPGGWWRLSVTQPSINTVYIQSANALTADPAYATTLGVTAMYVYGAQLTKGKMAGAYTRTIASTVNATYAPQGVTRTTVQGQNLLTYSEAFNDASWAGNALTISADTTVAPDGTKTAETLTASATGNVYLYKTTAIGAAQPVHTFSFFVKKGNSFNISMSDFISTGKSALFDGSTCALLAQDSLGAGWSITGYGCSSYNTDWWRVYVTFVHPAAPVGLSIGLNKKKVTGWGWAGGSDIGDTLVVWGAQLVYGGKPGAYNKTTTAAFNSSYLP